MSKPIFKRLSHVCIFVFCFAFVWLTGCQTQKPIGSDVVILYTNDVHCSIDEGIGYAGLLSYKEKMLEQTKYVALVDCGDAIQGELLGTVSQGEYIIDLMNETGYDYAVLGNHEFDYGMEQLRYLMESAAFPYLGCNISYTGSGENLLDTVEPYALKEYGEITVAFIGVSTPYSITTSTPKYFMDENGNLVYDFYNNSAESFYSCVQGYVDECVEAGADYVILLTHLGDGEEFSPYSSVELIANTTDVDVVLDGHSHSVISSAVVENQDGGEVLLSSTGTGLTNIGQLVITQNGVISTGLISSYGNRNAEMEEYVLDIKKSYEEEMKEVLAVSDTYLSCSDENGVRLVRNRETTIGNFCADAYRFVSGADIAFIQGGGIRADLPKGDITYADLLAVHPWANTLCMVEASGKEILDALEFGSRFVEAEYAFGQDALGENGGFLQVSGLRFCIDTKVDSTVETDENELFASVAGAYRVSEVEVQNADGSYSPLNPEETYTLASTNYIIKDCGDGYNMFADNALLIDEGMTDYQMLATYIQKSLNGNLFAYSDIEGRITVK